MLTLFLYLFATLSTLTGILIAFKLLYTFHRFKLPAVTRPVVDELPSVSVCIPARNETHAMTQCLERVIASTYPKLEIVVLDDSSKDNTSVLIKSFAHAGVRFVEGSPLPEGWIGKNHALEGLLYEASGSYILFMDVDTHIEPQTISRMVDAIMQKNLLMVSVLPLRSATWRPSVSFGTLRYFWELLLHRTNMPATSSSAWIIHRHTLRDRLKGFEPVMSVAQPETTIAEVLSKTHGYQFIIGTPDLGIRYEKKWSSQIDTSIRLLYPLFGGSIVSSIAILILFLLANVPTFVLLVTLGSEWTLVQSIALAHTIIYGLVYCLYTSKTWRRGWWIGLLVWPYVIAQELVVFCISVVRHASHRVTWKGRPIFITRF